MLKDWFWIPFLLTMDSSNSDSLTKVFMNSLKLCGGILEEHIVNRLVSFGADGINVFQGM